MDIRNVIVQNQPLKNEYRSTCKNIVSFLLFRSIYWSNNDKSIFSFDKWG